MVRSDWNIIFGPPGTGKTTTGIGIVEKFLNDGIQPEKIGYIAFTRKAALEAKARAQYKFGFGLDDIPYFRTIHSLCFMQLGTRPSHMIRMQHYREIGELLGIEIKYSINVDEDFNSSLPMGNRMFFLENLSRVKQCSLKDVWEENITDDIEYAALLLLKNTLSKYKEKHQLIDFTDLLDLFVRIGIAPKLEVLFIDEAQDLSPLQWKVIHKLAEKIPAIYIAGDDDQGIYRWAGADVEQLINLQGNRKVLAYSYRIPRKIHSLAKNVITRVKNRVDKKFDPKPEEGYIQYYNGVEDLSLDKGEWLLLARNKYLLKRYEQICIQNGFAFESITRKKVMSNALAAIKAWNRLLDGESIAGYEVKKIKQFHKLNIYKIEDERLYEIYELNIELLPWQDRFEKMPVEIREYFLSAINRDEDLLRPRIRINTIHGAKGTEADHVALITDMSTKTRAGLDSNPDDEHRVFYVAITRAKCGINIIEPQSLNFYEI